MSEGRVSNTDLADWRDFLRNREVPRNELWRFWRLLDVIEKWWNKDADTETLQSCADQVAFAWGWSGSKPKPRGKER